jgi:hypothetical protein
MSKRVLSQQFDPKAAVNALPKTSRYDLAISSAMQDVHDQGLREDADDDGRAFWTQVHGQVLSEIDD